MKVRIRVLCGEDEKYRVGKNRGIFFVFYYWEINIMWEGIRERNLFGVIFS